MTCGIYKIDIGGETYVGKSQNIENRWKAHLSDLVAGRHHNQAVQLLYVNGNKPDFSILEITTMDELSEKELSYILKYGTLNRSLYTGHSSILPLAEEEKYIKALEYYLCNKASTIPECSELFSVEKKTLYNIKSGYSYLYLRDIYEVVNLFISEPTRYNTNKSAESIEAVQLAVNDMSLFRYESRYLSEKYKVGDLAAVIHRGRFKEVEIPKILTDGIEFMSKYYDVLSDYNVDLITRSVNWENYGSSITSAAKHLNISRPKVFDIVERRSNKWGWAYRLRPDLWIPNK